MSESLSLGHFQGDVRVFSLLKHAGWRCVDVCPDREMRVAPNVLKTRPTAVFDGACIDECPLNSTMDMETRACIPCQDTCEKSKLNSRYVWYVCN